MICPGRLREDGLAGHWSAGMCAGFSVVLCPDLAPGMVAHAGKATAISMADVEDPSLVDPEVADARKLRSDGGGDCECDGFDPVVPA